MSVQLFIRLRNPALFLALAAAFPPGAYALGAASIDFSVGNVMAVNAEGKQRPLSKGAEIVNGDTISTGDGSRAQVRFTDGAMVSLQPRTEFRIDDYQYSDKADGEEKGFFQYGGSTVIVLVEKGRITVREDLLTHSTNDTETPVKLGEVLAYEKMDTEVSA